MSARRVFATTVIMSYWLSELAVVASSAAEANNYFVRPGPPERLGNYAENDLYTLGSLVRLHWVTNYTEWSLVIRQDKSPDFRYLPGLRMSFHPCAYEARITPS
jgi:hypothetical protein